LIADENVVITISHAGYIKTNLTEYKTQNRERVGQKKRRTRDQDFLYVNTQMKVSDVYEITGAVL
jgi:DNA gyrase subunit A